VRPSEWEPPAEVRHEWPRQTGRTTRQLLGVLALAEAGERVAYVGNKEALATYRRMLDEMADAAGIDVRLVRFVEYWPERPNERVIFDHHQAPCQGGG
jgi:16S rRNA G1207 methylase RsmC